MVLEIVFLTLVLTSVFTVVFFASVGGIRGNFKSLVNKGILYYSVTMPRYLNVMTACFVVALCLIFVLVFLLVKN